MLSSSDSSTTQVGRSFFFATFFEEEAHPANQVAARTIENTTNKTLYIEDQLSNGLDFIADTTGDYAMVVKSDTNVTLVEGTNFSLDYTNRKLTLHFDGDDTPAGKNKYYNTIKTYDEITITYTIIIVVIMRLLLRFVNLLISLGISKIIQQAII